LTLQVKPSNQSNWSYIGSTTSFPNPVEVVVKAPPLYADEYEPNNSRASASTLIWDLDPEISDFDTWRVSLHEDADIDYYKVIFPNSNEYKVFIRLCDKYNNQGWYYENGDAQFAYSVGENSYSEYSKNDKTATFDGPNILYICVKQYGMNGLGYYELKGDVEETANPNIQDISCEQASQIASRLDHNTPTTETYNVIGYVTETDGIVSKGQQIFWMADTENGGKVFESYWCNVPEQIKVGDYVSVKGNILRYNATYEIKHGDVILIERKSIETLDNIEAPDSLSKTLRDGQLYILRGDKTYNITGQIVR
jgi:hypothetical protein